MKNRAPKFKGFRKVRVWYEFNAGTRRDPLRPYRYSFWCHTAAVPSLLRVWEAQGTMGGVVE